MNPVFVILVISGAVLLWFLLSFVFYPLGKFIYRIWKDAVNEMKKKDKVKTEKEKK